MQHACVGPNEYPDAYHAQEDDEHKRPFHDGCYFLGRGSIVFAYPAHNPLYPPYPYVAS